MSDTNVVSAKKQVSLEDIKFNEKNKTMAILSWIGLVGTVMFFVEKEDNYVRYVGAQSTLVWLIVLVLSSLLALTGILACISLLLSFASLGVMIYGMIKTSKGERWDIPVVSGWAIKIMNSL